MKANTKAEHKNQKDPADVWGTAYSTAFEFPTADPIISKTGLRVRFPEGGCLTEDTMIKLDEEQQQNHSDEVMRIATNRADAKWKGNDKNQSEQLYGVDYQEAGEGRDGRGQEKGQGQR